MPEEKIEKGLTPDKRTLDVLVADIRAHTKITSHFKRRCTPHGCVAKARNILIFLRFRALSNGRLNT